MAITYGANIQSLRAQRLLSVHTADVSRSQERLSSGLRINRASDDAASLSVSSNLSNSSRQDTQAIRNVNDGISALNIAEGALASLTTLTTRIKELAHQAANGSYSLTQRKSLDAEAQALVKEFDRIVEGTSFNKQRLLDGSLSQLTIQAGTGTDVLQVGVENTTLPLEELTSGYYTRHTISTANDPSESHVSDINGDTFVDMLTVAGGSINIHLGNGDGTFKAATSLGGAGYLGVTTADVNGDSILDTIGSMTGGQFVNGIFIHLGNGNGTFKAGISYQSDWVPLSPVTGNFNGDSYLDVAVLNYNGGTGSIFYGNSDGSFKAQSTFVVTNGTQLRTADMDGNGYTDLIYSAINGPGVAVRLSNGNGTFKAEISAPVGQVQEFDLADLNNDGILDIVAANQYYDASFVLLGTGGGTFGTATTFVTTPSSGDLHVDAADLDQDGNQDVVITDDASKTVNIFLGNGNGTFKPRVSYAQANAPSKVLAEDVNGDGVPDIIYNQGGTSDNTTVLTRFTLRSVQAAKTAIDLTETALNSLAVQVGKIGAHSTRLQTAANVIFARKIASDAAHSRISDVDVAQESSIMVSRQIAQQSAIAILSQANQLPSIALSLLK